jgi:hypothetical protein
MKERMNEAICFIGNDIALIQIPKIIVQNIFHTIKTKVVSVSRDGDW